MKNAASSGKRVGYGWLYNWYATRWFAPWEAKYYDEGESVSYNGHYWTCDDVIIDVLKPPGVSSAWIDRGSILNIAPDGWRVPTYPSDIDSLINHLASNIGGKLKSRRNEWLSPNTGATNSSLFSALPGGLRNSLSYGYLGSHLYFFLSAPQTWSHSWNRPVAILEYNSNNITVVEGPYTYRGLSVRVVQNKQFGETDGNTGTLTDIDGNIYPWVVIGDLRWSTENLRTTRYRDGTSIPELTVATNWGTIDYGARCAYDDDHYLVYPPMR